MFENLLIAINAAAVLPWHGMVWKQEKGTGHLQEQEDLSRVSPHITTLFSLKKWKSGEPSRGPWPPNFFYWCKQVYSFYTFTLSTPGSSWCWYVAGSNNQVVWWCLVLCPTGIYVDLEFLAQILSTETPHSSPPIFQSIYNSRPNALKQPPFYRCPSAVSTGGKILSIGHQNS